MNSLIRLCLSTLLILHLPVMLAPVAMAKSNSTTPETKAQLYENFTGKYPARRSLGRSNIMLNSIDRCLTQVHWMDDRKHLANCGIGFGKGTVGGKGGKFYVVTDSSDDDTVTTKPGTLRDAVIQKEPLWIIFKTSMTIKLKGELIFNSYKTVDGRGAKVHITGHGCATLQDVEHIIIHGVNIYGCKPNGNFNVRSSPTHYGFRTMSDGDAISVFNSSNVWIDHCSLSNCADGLVDVVMASTDVTISNSHFFNHDEVLLIGHSDGNTEDANIRATICLNKFGGNLVQRLPRVRFGLVEVVNNYYDHPLSYAIGVGFSSKIIIRNNFFRAPEDINHILHYSDGGTASVYGTGNVVNGRPYHIPSNVNYHTLSESLEPVADIRAKAVPRAIAFVGAH